MDEDFEDTGLDELDEDTDGLNEIPEEKLVQEEDVYSIESSERLVDGDELRPEEAGFMAGYSEA